MVWPFFFRIFKKSLLARIYAAMLVVVLLDTLVFVSASFYGQDNYSQVLLSGLIGKCTAAIIYSLMLYGYLRMFKDAAVRADQRLYAGKNAGRDRIVTTNTPQLLET